MYVPMPIEDQVAIIYCGVRDCLDKSDLSIITEFEIKFVEHIKGKLFWILKFILTALIFQDATETY